MDLLDKINEAHKDVDLYALGEKIAVARNNSNAKSLAEGLGFHHRKAAMNEAQDEIMLAYKIDNTDQDLISRKSLAELAIETYENIEFG